MMQRKNPLQFRQKDEMPFENRARGEYIARRNSHREEKKRATRKTNTAARLAVGFVAQKKIRAKKSCKRAPPPHLQSATPPPSM